MLPGQCTLWVTIHKPFVYSEVAPAMSPALWLLWAFSCVSHWWMCLEKHSFILFLVFPSVHWHSVESGLCGPKWCDCLPPTWYMPPGRSWLFFLFGSATEAQSLTCWWGQGLNLKPHGYQSGLWLLSHNRKSRSRLLKNPNWGGYGLLCLFVFLCQTYGIWKFPG